MCPDAEMKDQRAPNRRTPNVPVSFEDLRDLGLLHWGLDPKTMFDPTEVTHVDSVTGEKTTTLTGLSAVDRICQQMEYKNKDEVKCAPGHLPDYENRLKSFFTEHIHEDEEIRLIKDGTGYFDVRNRQDEWIRIKVCAGDLLVLPAGIYHRFTMDEQDYTHAMRLFKEAPKWTPINRPCDSNDARVSYVEAFTAPGRPLRKTILDAASASAIRGEDVASGKPIAAAEGGLNIYVHYPSDFDGVVKTLKAPKGSPRFAPNDVVLFYVTGTHNPTTKKSWCPDCVAADPVLQRSIEEARAQLKQKATEAGAASQEGYSVHLIQCAVERSAYRANPDYAYRKHPFLSIRCIPTVVAAVVRVTDEQIDEDGFDVVFKQDDVITDAWKAAALSGRK